MLGLLGADGSGGQTSPNRKPLARRTLRVREAGL